MRLIVLEKGGRVGGGLPVLCDDVVAARVQGLLAPVGHGDLGARRAPLALLKFATHCVCGTGQGYAVGGFGVDGNTLAVTALLTCSVWFQNFPAIGR